MSTFPLLSRRATLLSRTRHPQPKPCRILVVDDATDIADVLVEAFSSLGYDARPIYAGSEAFDIVAAWHPDVLFVDIVLPALDGLALATLIRNQSALPDIVLVGLTALPATQLHDQFLASGFDAYCEKPADLDDLIRIVEFFCPVK